MTRRHPSYHLTDAELDRFDDEGINDPPAAWITREYEESGYDGALDWFAAGVEKARAATNDYEREAS